MQNSSNTFLASRRHAKYAALCIKPTELRNSVLVNKCVQCQILQRPGCQEQEQEAGLCTCRPWTGCSAPLSTKPATPADSHSATIRRQLYLFKLLLFYSYVFRPHHDKTMFKLRRCKTQNLPSKMAAACIAKNANSHHERSFDNTGRQNNTKSTLLNRRNALRKCSSVFIQHNGTIIESQVQPWFHIEIHHIVSFLRCLPLAHQ